MAASVSGTNLRHRHPTCISEGPQTQTPLLHENIYAPPVGGPTRSLKNVTKVTAPQELRLKLGTYVGGYSSLFGRHGSGKMIYDNGLVYEGEWRFGLRHGQGKMTFSSKSEWVGQWVLDDFKEGKVSYTSGAVYEGKWNKEPHGKGSMTYSSGEVVEGQWIKGRIFVGKKTYANGNVYEGAFLGDELYGKGKMTYANGDVYEGYLLRSKPHGKGKMTRTDGQVIVGVWDATQRISSIEE